MKARAAFALLLLTAAIGLALQVRVVRRTAAAPAALTAYVPQDALLTIESPDFAALLHRWTNSAESRAWLASDNYGVFQNSRLFGRLADAQDSFAKAAGLPVEASAGADLLNQLAGKESVFAWYDIGKLEFLYITRMPASQADRARLFQARGTFKRRHAGNADFYLRSSSADYSTVAFAEVPTASGELVLLATREDLIANALTLIAGHSTLNSAANSVQQEPWFRDASAALPAENPAPALHMVLNLDRIAPDPHFRSYWIQRNITWTRQFRTAASDLYLESARFREERVLISKSAQPQAASPAVAALAALVPPATGVFRAVATQDPAVAVTAIQEKLLSSYSAPPPNPEYAPDPNLEAPQSGSASDLETRIDTLPPAPPSASLEGLTRTLQAASLDAVLTLSSAQTPVQDGLWAPIHSAVVLHTAGRVDPQTLASALQQALRGTLTVAGIGIGFQPGDAAGAPVYALTGVRPLFFAVPHAQAQANLVLLADDRALLLELLRNAAANPQPGAAPPATSIAVFNHASQRAPYLRLTSLIDRTNGQVRDSSGASRPAPGGTSPVASTPTFFSQNIGSLSGSFASLQSERVVERVVDSSLRQTVTYAWEPR